LWNFYVSAAAPLVAVVVVVLVEENANLRSESFARNCFTTSIVALLPLLLVRELIVDVKRSQT